MIEPLDRAGEEGRHALYRAEHLQQKLGTCGVSDTSLEQALGPRTLAAFRPRVSRGARTSCITPVPWDCIPQTCPVPGQGSPWPVGLALPVATETAPWPELEPPGWHPQSEQGPGY